MYDDDVEKPVAARNWIKVTTIRAKVQIEIFFFLIIIRNVKQIFRVSPLKREHCAMCNMERYPRILFTFINCSNME